MLSFLREFWIFLRVRKKFWLAPVMIMFLIFGGLLVAVQGLRDRAIHLHRLLSRHRRVCT